MIKETKKAAAAAKLSTALDLFESFVAKARE